LWWIDDEVVEIDYHSECFKTWDADKRRKRGKEHFSTEFFRNDLRSSAFFRVPYQRYQVTLGIKVTLIEFSAKRMVGRRVEQKAEGRKQRAGSSALARSIPADGGGFNTVGAFRIRSRGKPWKRRC
jgi:hypothetical protein